jgi:hypothetical protein
VDVFPGLGSLNLLCLPPEHEPPAGDYLLPATSVEDWPAWWPDWSAQAQLRTGNRSSSRAE